MLFLFNIVTFKFLKQDGISNIETKRIVTLSVNPSFKNLFGVKSWLI